MPIRYTDPKMSLSYNHTPWYHILINLKFRIYHGGDRRDLRGHHGVRDVAGASDGEGSRPQSPVKLPLGETLPTFSSIQFTRAPGRVQTCSEIR